MTKHTLKELATLTKSELVGAPDHTIDNVDTLESATSSDASFLANPRYFDAMKLSKAGVICISTDTEKQPNQNYLISDNPSRTFQQIAELILPSPQTAFTGIHETAVIHPSASIGKDVSIGPYAVIDQNVTIGDHSHIGPHVSIGPATTLGTHCHIHAHVSIRERCEIGNRVIIQPGAVIGSCGYGYTMDTKGRHIKLGQIGNVILEDDVEIGANTTIDRARFKCTRIGRGTKLDNLVQIGHNVCLGQDNLIISQSGIAGSASTGRHVFMGGQGGIVGHIHITDNVQIATRGGVSKDITQSGIYGGGPVMPIADFNKMQVHTRKLESYAKKLKELEKRLKDLEK